MRLSRWWHMVGQGQEGIRGDRGMLSLGQESTDCERGWGPRTWGGVRGRVGLRDTQVGAVSCRPGAGPDPRGPVSGCARTTA